MSVFQAQLCAQYQHLSFFDGTFQVTPNLYYQLCPYHIYIPLYKTTILGGLALLNGKSIEHYQFAFHGIKSIVNKYTLGGQDCQPHKFMIDKEAAILAAIKLNWVNNTKLCYFHFDININKRINNNYFKNL